MSVLVVDDVEINLIVAQELLKLHKQQVETADNGFDVLDKIKGGKVYDIILMDCLMPKMDGMETTRELRRYGYTGTVIALTANNSVIDDASKLFDGIMSKPIDLKELNGILNKYIPGRQSFNIASPRSDSKVRLERAFTRDAQKAITALREALAKGNIKSLTSWFHGMKSALRTVGEIEKSATAYELEKAGLSGDMEYINANTEAFIKALEGLLPTETSEEYEETGNEEAAFVKQQLEAAKVACDDYDDTSAYAVFDALLAGELKIQTRRFVEQIRDLLYSDSDFDDVLEKIDEFLYEY